MRSRGRIRLVARFATPTRGEDAFPELQRLSQMFANLVPTERIQVDERPLERISRR
jgi:hypothetical protein